MRHLLPARGTFFIEMKLKSRWSSQEHKRRGKKKRLFFAKSCIGCIFFFVEMNSQKDCEISAEASTKSAWDAWSVLFFDPTPLYKRAIIIVMSTSHVHYVQTRRIWTYEMHLCKMHLYKIEAKKRILMNEDCITDLTKILGYKFHWEEFTEICYRLFFKKIREINAFSIFFFRATAKFWNSRTLREQDKVSKNNHLFCVLWK